MGMMMTPSQKLILYKEWYGCKPKQANVGIELTPVQISDGIIEREFEEAKNNIGIQRTADPAIFDKSRGDSVADQMAPGFMGRTKGVIFSKGDHARLPGLMQVHERLRFDENGDPKFQVFNTCKGFIRTFPNLPYDEKKVEDVDSSAEDHPYDTFRYVAMDHPLTPTKRPTSKQKAFSPFDDGEDD